MSQWTKCMARAAFAIHMSLRAMPDRDANGIFRIFFFSIFMDVAITSWIWFDLAIFSLICSDSTLVAAKQQHEILIPMVIRLSGRKRKKNEKFGV